MPPFITHNGQTGYFQNGVFTPMSRQQYDMQFGYNPFMAAQQTALGQLSTQQNAIQQGTIQPPMAGPLSNEQKISIKQGDATTTDVVNNPIAQNNQSVNNASVNNNPFIQPMQNFGGIMAGQMYKFNNPNFTSQSQIQQKVNNISQPAPESELLQSAADAAQNVTTNAIQNTPSGVLSNASNNAVTSNAATVTDPILQNMGKGPGEFFQDQMQNANNAAANATKATATKATSDGLDGLGFSGKWNFSPSQAFNNSKDFFASEAGQATSAGIGAGLGIATSLAAKNASVYDPRVGMSKPNAWGTIASDSTVTQIGLNPALMAATGGLSAVAGLTIDAIKNSIKYVKQKDKYENKKLAVDTMQQLDDARENMKPDYTGYARNGTQVNPYLKAQYGTAIIDGKKMDIDSDEYRRLYNSGNLMRVDEGGMPTMTTKEVVITEQMPEETRKQREIQKERDAQGLNYNFGTGSQNPYMSQLQSTVPTGMNYTVPSVPPFQPIFNPEDDLLNIYRGKSFGSMPFPYNNSAGIGMGYNDAGNNAWMSTGLGSIEDPTTILGHLDYRYGKDVYEQNLKNNDIPTLYFFEKDLSKEKQFIDNVLGSADKYYDSRKELLELGDDLEREARYINDVLLPQGYSYNVVDDQPGNKLIRSLTPDKDRFMGSVTLTPEMYKALLETPNQTEAKRRLMQMAKIPQDVDMDKLFIHMNLSRPKNLSAYLKAKTVNPESVKGWHNERPGNKYDKNGNLIKPTVKTYKQGGVVNPYLMAQYGTSAYIPGTDYNVTQSKPPFKKKDSDLENAMSSFNNMTTNDGLDEKGNYIYYDNPSGKGSLDSDLVFGLAELTGIPSLYRVAKDPVGHLQSGLRLMHKQPGTGLPIYSTPEDVSKSLDIVGAASTVMPFAKPVASGVNQAAKTTGKFLTTQTPLKNTYKINPFALKEDDVEILQRWQFDNANNKYHIMDWSFSGGDLPKKYEGKFYSSNFDNQRKEYVPIGVPSYMMIRPGSGQIQTAVVKKGTANIPKEVLDNVSNINFPNVERLLPEGIPYTITRVENNPMDIFNTKPFSLEETRKLLKKAQKISDASIPKPNWLTGYGKK